MSPPTEPPHAYYEVFADFAGDCWYVEVEKHGGLNMEKARSAVQANWETDFPEDFTLTPIYMRYMSGEDAQKVSAGEYDECWAVCLPHEDGSYPFYRVEEA